MLWAYFFFSSDVFFIAKNKNSKLLIIMMEMRLLFKHYPQIRRVSSFTVYAFKVSTFLQSSVNKSGDHDQVGFSSQMDLLPCNAVF